MIGAVLAIWLGSAQATDHEVIREGDTVESIAEALGAGDRVDEIRSINRLQPGEQPSVGTVLVLPVLAGDHVDHQAAVLSHRGSVVARIRGRDRPASVGMILPLGATVCTGEDGYATLRLAVAASGGEHDDLSLFPSTCLTVDGTSSRKGERSSLVQVETGSVSVRNAVGGDGPGTVTVITPSGITSGDQGGFRVTIEQAAARTEALDAPASVFGAEHEVRLPAGHGSRVKTGERPSDPVKLLAPGTPTAPDSGAPLLVPEFTWVGVDGALGYRVELAAAPDFSDTLRIEDVPSASWVPDRLFLPYRVPGIWWRVSSIDRVGFVGAPSQVRELTIPEAIGP